MILPPQTIFIAILISIVTFAVFIIPLSVVGKKQTSVTRQGFAIGTVIQIQAYGIKPEKALDDVVSKLAEIDDKMSVLKDYSEVSRINKNAGEIPQKISKDTYNLIKKAVYYSGLTNGAFDPTIRPVVSLYNFAADNPVLPDESEIKNSLSLVGYESISFDASNRSIMLKSPGQSFNLGGIAKGFASEEIKKVLKKHRIDSALINIGGNIQAVGNKSDGKPWNVGIQSPLKPRGEYIGTLSLSNKSVVTSGNYEKFFIKDGRIYHHIIDPKTGYPTENEIVSITIISDNSIDGYALSIGIYILGIEDGMRLIESIARIDAVFITIDKKVIVTAGIKNNLNLTDNNYELIN